MLNAFKLEINKLKKKSHVDKKVLRRFITRLKIGNLTKNHHRTNHFCSFFLPIDTQAKLIYFGHHIKANDWIPPGGHIQPDESPTDTVKREFYEELKYKLTNEKVELFDLTIKDVSGNPLHTCKVHYDFWYLVYMQKTHFIYDRKEFYQAEWFSLPDAIKLMKLRQYITVIQKLNSNFHTL